MGTFGQRLKELRNQRGISQNELSKYIGVSKSSVNMYERGEREPGFETLEAIADFFNVSMDYLLGRESGISPVDSLSRINGIVSEFVRDEDMNVDVTVNETGGFSIGFREGASRDDVIKLLSEFKKMVENFDGNELSQNDLIQLFQIYFLNKGWTHSHATPGTLRPMLVPRESEDTAPSPDTLATSPEDE